jgi:hypothetical protein
MKLKSLWMALSVAIGVNKQKEKRIMQEKLNILFTQIDDLGKKNFTNLALKNIILFSLKNKK